MRGLPSGAAILILGPSGAALGRKVRDLLPGARLYGPRHHAGGWDETYDRAVPQITELFAAGTAVLPGLDRLWLSRAAADFVAHHPFSAGAPLVAIGYGEPSLVFLLGGHVRLTPSSAAADTLRGGGVALVSNREEPTFRQTLSAHGLNAHPLGAVAGFDYSNGQRMVLTLFDVGRNE